MKGKVFFMRFNPLPITEEGGYFLHCLDPGGDSGLALLYIKRKDFDLVDYRTVPYDPHGDQEMPTETLIEWKLNYPGSHRLVYEDFHVRNTKAQKDTTALKVIGSVDQMLFDRRIYERVHAQQPVEAKDMVTDEDLGKLGLLLGGNEARHMRDALRHGITYLTRARYLPVCRIAYPQGGGATRGPKNRHPGLHQSAGSTPAR